jgi:tail tube protein
MVATILTNAAETNRAVLYYIPEITWGTTPGSGTVRTMRITSSSLQAKKTTKLSNEIRADRMVSDVIATDFSTDGNIKWEMSAGGQDDFYQQFLLATWSKSMNYWLVKGTAVSTVTTSKVRVAGKDWTGWLANNQYIKLEGFLNPTNNGYFKISSFSYTGGNTDIITVETSLVVEVGTAYTKVMDANDVLVKSTAFTIVSGNKLFLDDWTVGQGLQVGQRLYVEGLGKETGSIAIGPALPANNDTFLVTDGVNPITFEIADTAALASTGHVYINRALTPDVLMANIQVAIMDQFRKQNFRVAAAQVAGTKQVGSFAFAATASATDTVSINDGRTTVVFTFVASGAVLGSGNVNIGASATASGHNLKLEIDAQVAAGPLNVSATDVTGTVTVTNNLFTGGTLLAPVNAGADDTVTAFTSGTKPKTNLTNGVVGGGGDIDSALAYHTVVDMSGGDATMAGFFTIASLPDEDTVVTNETLTANANGGGLTVVVKGSHIRNASTVAGITKQSMSAETGFTDVTKYLSHNGLRVGDFTMNLQPSAIVTGDFTIMGRQTATLNATVLGTAPYTVLDANSESVFNSTSNVGDILRNGAALTTAILKLDVKGAATLRMQPAVGAKFPAGIGYGRFTLTGAMDCYFQNFDLYNDFINHTTASLLWSMEDGDHMKYYFTVPSIKYDSDPIAPTGIDKDVTETIAWTAFRDSTLGTMFMIDRFSGVWPTSVA